VALGALLAEHQLDVIVEKTQATHVIGNGGGFGKRRMTNLQRRKEQQNAEERD
jgi:hypothetical protein